MQFDWIVTPLAQWAFLALSLIGCLALFWCVKVEIAAISYEFKKTSDSAATLTTELDTLRQKTETSEAVAPANSAGGQRELNPARRSEALRMQNRGESPATIAATLRVPRNEIDLLIKIQRLTNRATADN